MKRSVKISVYISTVIAAIIITAFTTYFLTTQVFSPIGPGGNGDTSPVNIAADTKVFWNGKDITETWTHNIKYDGLTAELVEGAESSMYSRRPEQYIPKAQFVYIALKPGDVPNVDTTDAIALLWTFDDEPYAFAQNGKTVKSISFSGLDDSALLALTLDGVILRLPPELQFQLTFQVKDSRNVTNTTVWGNGT